ncbi:hypothetical protein GC197_03675 [bacterium]|nr:hypothetical protein [bacterium]
MKYSVLPLLVTIGFFLLSIGCEQPKNNVPPTTGDFIKTIDDTGTARVLGVDFHVALKSSGVETDELINLKPDEPNRSFLRKMFKMGDDINITLIKDGEKPITFEMNKMNYGTLNVGDKVEIDLDQKVTVNGEVRPSLGPVEEPEPMPMPK